MALADGSSVNRLGVAESRDDSHSPKHLDVLSSPVSTPPTTTPDSTPFLSLADQNFTPLSLVDDSYDGDKSVAGEVGGGKPTADMDQLTALGRGRLGAGSRGLGAREARDSVHDASAVVSAVSNRASPETDSEPCVNVDVDDRRHRQRQSRRSFSQSRNLEPSNCARNNPNNPSASSRSHQHETLGPVLGRRATRSVADTASSPKIALHGHDFSLEAHDTFCLPPLSSDFPPPLRTGSVQTDTVLAQPRPNIVRTASDHGSLPLKHPTPDLNCRSGAYVGNVAQLEATAERLSLTSSIEDAIRDLHGELKRSESRRSSQLAARIRANSADDSWTPASSVGQLKRHLSTSSSIVSTNIAARHGGYSPAAYVMSPAHSLTGRLRSGSKTSTGRPEIDVNSLLSRHGPGKSSVRSIRSTKLSLAEISEMEPTSLTKDAFDRADSQPPIKNDNDDSPLPAELRDANMPTTDVFHKMMGNDDFWDSPNPRSSSGIADPNGHLLPNDPPRPGSSGSTNTFQQCQNAFEDFDGVHWEPIPEDDPYAPPEEPELPTPRMPPPNMVRPQSYMDPESGQQMLYYPARVPAMLNLPPKLSNKPKAADRNNRRSQVLSMMVDKRQSRVLDRKDSIPENARDSWLPDPLAGHRDSFIALSSEQLNLPGETQSVHTEENVAQSPVEPAAEPAEPAEPLRRPQRLSRMDPEKRKSRMSRLDTLPPQLRASAYFDIPDTSAPEVEVKDGSAMATLESILDASAHAPVSAFTDHNFAGKLGTEIYGKEKKRASMAPSAHLRTSSSSNHLRTTSDEKGTKKRHSFMWLGKRHSHASDEKEHHRSVSDGDGLGLVNADTRATEDDALAASDDGSHVIRLEVDGVEYAEEEEEEQSEAESYQGPPTTLLAELQLRKQRQKLRTQGHFPHGMHSTLLEMDAVAETERKKRENKRVNLAWEDANGLKTMEESDDEDVPLAIIAARSQGAQNVMDLNRPIGLMERREIEENEPLSHRRARLTGQEPPQRLLHRPSNMNLSVNMGSQPPLSPGEPLGPEEEEVEGETLADRKRRLAAKEAEENPLPKARPVSSVFSAELLSQFGDLDDKKEKENTPPKAPGEETLGQRRRRLQAEREAREQEMNYNALTGVPGPAQRPMQMSQVLAAHPKKETDFRAQEQRRHIEEQNRLARERDAKMAAMRNQMPTTLIGPNLNRSGGFHSGQFNDGTGGQGLQPARSSPALNQVYSAGNYQNRASAVFSAYGGPVQQPHGMGAMSNMGGYSGMNTLAPYGAGVYGGGMMQPKMQMQMQMPLNGGSMDRVEQWRQGVLP
ncbi:Fc.00g032330.m01.CDS01 [Cosmosporella sp. VM-42]